MFQLVRHQSYLSRSWAMLTVHFRIALRVFGVVGYAQNICYGVLGRGKVTEVLWLVAGGG